MAAFNFPNSPSTNDTHTENSVTWKWNGTVWKRQGVAGAQGAVGAQGAQGAAGAVGAQGAVGVSVANNADNRVITGGSGTNLNGEANLTFDGSTVKLLNASAPQIRINNDTSDGSSTRLMIGKATASNNFFNGAAAGDSCISAPTNLLLGNTTAERLRIDSSGRLLLGLTSSIGGNAIFQVQGSGNRKAHFHQPDTGSCIVQFTNTTTGTSTSDGATIGLDGDESLLISQKENNHIAFHTNNAEKLRITSDGTLNKYLSGTTVQAAFGGAGQVNGIASIPSMAGTPFVVGRDSGSTRSAHFAGNLKFDSGYGIDFAANTAGGGTSSSTVLEDYEEGSYSSSIVSSNCTLDSTSGTGYYIKVGNMVHVRGTFSMNTNSGSPSKSGSDSIVQALPYTPNGNGIYTGTMLQQNWNWGGTTSLSHPHYFNPVVADYVCLAASDGIRFYMNRIEYAYLRLTNEHLHVGFPGYTFIGWCITYQTT